MTNPPVPSLPFPSRFASLAAALVVAAGLGACAIPLPDRDRASTSPAADAAVPLPPGVTPGQVERPIADRGAPISQPMTFRGVIPCADCEGQRITLTLLPDWTWRMRRVYFGTRQNKDMTFVSTGRWERLVDSPDRIRLIGDRNEGGLYEFVSGTTLRMLDQNGEPIQSALNYALTQQFELDWISEPFPMRGRVVSKDGESTIAICSTGKRYPVAPGGQGQALANAYSKLRVAPGTPVLMWIEGRIVRSGEPPRESVQVERLTRGTLDSPCDD
ncbi:MAG: copper resistance protein NlpE N-terminal domain-containing protein [Pigmentiphaga sp.]|uniref:copper resistance protein NlpE N-terminal domain-containing protein n=1 Tax=Pigmentiphaga sp. TaxID=1977564 RepID=UPI0029A33F53|nr:copper resistance protein NlpE N-terminal domain-containing protein [Pigmentiphaga sp.]MDX3906825.1 copper resistance protein NlpE N-terminal domain-containing protein [Pigmentiphaga sp.]